LSSADSSTPEPDRDRLLPLGSFSPRQEAVSYLLRIGVPYPVVARLAANDAVACGEIVRQHIIYEEEGWLASNSVNIDKIQLDKNQVLVFLKCGCVYAIGPDVKFDGCGGRH
jgi:hypothetical protein